MYRQLSRDLNLEYGYRLHKCSSNKSATHQSKINGGTRNINVGPLHV